MNAKLFGTALLISLRCAPIPRARSDYIRRDQGPGSRRQRCRRTRSEGITTISPLYGNIIAPANPSMDFLEGSKVDLSGNSAEFGVPGYVNVVTKGGTSRFHGSVSWYYNTAGLNARKFFQRQVGFAVLNDYGFNVSGPVIRNRTFFSGGLEGFQSTHSRPGQSEAPIRYYAAGRFLARARRTRQPGRDH